MTQWIASGTIDQSIYFTGPTGETSFTVYVSRDGGAASLKTPTITELDSATPGLFKLDLDSTMDTTIAAGNYSESYVIFISAAGFNTSVILTLFDPVLEAQTVWSENLGDSGYSASALVQVIAGAIGGKVSGAGTGTITIRSIEDDANIIVATVDTSGNRTAVTITTPGD